MLSCDKCKQTLFSAHEEKYHECSKFEIYEPSEGDTYEQYGSSASDVAEIIAFNRNNDEPVLNQDVFDFPIRIKDDQGIVKWFNVYAEPEITYSPSEVESPSEEKLNEFYGE